MPGPGTGGGGRITTVTVVFLPFLLCVVNKGRGGAVERTGRWLWNNGRTGGGTRGRERNEKALFIFVLFSLEARKRVGGGLDIATTALTIQSTKSMMARTVMIHPVRRRAKVATRAGSAERQKVNMT